jgi:hypothetical protein
MKKSFASLCIAAFCFWAGTAHAAPNLQVVNGKLMGVQGILVNGQSYDVSFTDGSCNSLFNNCDPNKFTFHSFSDAKTALSALLDQAFPLHSVFRDDASSINGCEEDPVYGSYCNVDTPILPGSLNFTLAELEVNDSSISSSAIITYDSAKDFDFSGRPHGTFAIWSLSAVSPAPEPSSAALYIAALTLFAIRRRRSA